MRCLLFFIFCSLQISLYAQAPQPDSLLLPDTVTTAKLQLQGYADVYFLYDFAKPATHERPAFLYNHKRSNEFSCNLALLSLSYSDHKTTARLSVMAGTYPQYNLANEQALFRLLYEASMGYKFHPKWLAEAGIFPSHIGVETAIASQNWNLSRSLLSENSPYYEAGLKLTYTPKPSWHATVLLLNGWQNIRETNQSKALGTQIQYKPSQKLLFNSSTFAGNEQPDSLSPKLRLFHNFYAVYTPVPGFGISITADAGAKEKHAAAGFAPWFGTALLVRHQFAQRWALALRAEHYHDTEMVIVKAAVPGGFRVSGYSANIDCQLSKYLVWRTEAKLYTAPAALFVNSKRLSHNNFSVLSSAAFIF